MKAAVKSEDLFLELFSEVFGAEKMKYLHPQFCFADIYHNTRYADFAFDNMGKRVAIEIDGEAVHNQNIVSGAKFDDDQIKQNSMVHYGWKVFRWSYRKLIHKAETVKDEMQLFFGQDAKFSEIYDYLPSQKSEHIQVEFTLKEHQIEALISLENMRKEGKTIALISHATGTGKTVCAITDARSVGGRTLFIAHTKELVEQAKKAFENVWKDESVGLFVDGYKETGCFNLCGSVQSVALNLSEFEQDEFDYIIIDEAHHAISESYQKLINYFAPKFLLGLTATPERSDGDSILDTFVNVAHKLDIKTAVELGQLVPVRCIRVKTNIDISSVRYNGVKYNAQELEKTIFIPERNKLIIETFLKYAAGKRSVIFCVSVKHAEEIATLLKENGVTAEAVSGAMSTSDRREALARFENGINVLCACDLLNEGWDSPKIEVLFMARPTMSKVLYMQQLGRGMRLSEGKKYLMVFDFVDNAGMFNSPYSLHILTGKNEYSEGELVYGSKKEIEADAELYRKGEKPEALIDFPIDTVDLELIDVFNWQQQAEGMKSQMAFVQMVDVQGETIEKYVRENKIIPDLIVPISEHKKLNYYKEEKIQNYAKEFGWRLIDKNTKKELFLEYIKDMDMSFSYKPVLVKAIFANIDNKGRVKLDDIVDYFIRFYHDRKKNGLFVEKESSIFARDFTKSEAQRNILANPYKRFEQMSMLRHTKTLGIIELDGIVFRRLSEEDKNWIVEWCDKKLDEYYKRDLNR